MLGQFDEAFANYDRALALRPDYAEAHTNRGVTLHALKRFDEALQCHERAVGRGRISPRRTTMRVCAGF